MAELLILSIIDYSTVIRGNQGLACTLGEYISTSCFLLLHYYLTKLGSLVLIEYLPMGGIIGIDMRGGGS